MINTLHLGLSYKCNMRCKHCFVNRNKDELNIETVKKTIDFLDENGLFFVVYTFGEPLLSEKFWEISEFISHKNIVQTVMSNGSLVNEKNIYRLRKNNIKNIYISLDSVISERHDKNRNFVGSYNKSVEALKLLIKENFNVGIAVTINDSNINEMDNFLTLAKENGVKNISFLRQRQDGKLIQLKEEDEYIEFYKKYLMNYDSYKINILFHDLSLVDITKKLYENKYISLDVYEKYMDMNSCHYNSTLSIEPNGNVKHCNLINNSIGNLNNQSIQNILLGGVRSECVGCCSKFSK